MNTDNKSLILSGTLATFTEMSFVGHIIEQIKIIKQSSGDSYPKILKGVKNDYSKNGIIAFYRGYYPWGVLQCVKGAPVLFVQDVVNNKLKRDHSNLLSGTNNYQDIQFRSSVIGGLCGGFSQAIILTPLQRMKTEIITVENNAPIKTPGIPGLYKGFTAMAAKRSLDWGARFAGIAEFKRFYPEFSETYTGIFVGGVIGGLCSLISMPFEVVLAMKQKHNSLHNNTVQIFNEIGLKQITRGMCFKALDSCYHTSMVMMLTPFYKKWIDELL